MIDLKEVFRKRSKGTLKRFRYEANKCGTCTIAQDYHPEVDFSDIDIQDLIKVLNEMIGGPPEDDYKIFI